MFNVSLIKLLKKTHLPSLLIQFRQHSAIINSIFKKMHIQMFCFIHSMKIDGIHQCTWLSPLQGLQHSADAAHDVRNTAIECEDASAQDAFRYS